MIRLLVVSLVASFLGVAVAKADVAEQGPLISPETLSLRLGGFFIRNAESELRVDPAIGPIGTIINYSRTLGGESRDDAYRLDGYYRFDERQRLEFAHYSIDRSGRRTLDVDVSYGDQTFNINETVESSIETDILKLAYSYSLYRNADIELGLGAGLHLTDIRAELRSLDSGTLESASVLAPLPVLGFRLDYAFAPRWMLRVRSDSFFLDYHEYSGSLVDSEYMIEHRTTRHFGFGGGINNFSSQLSIEDPDYYGDIANVWKGWFLYARYYH